MTFRAVDRATRSARWPLVEFRRVAELVEVEKGEDRLLPVLSLTSTGEIRPRDGDGRQPPSADYLRRYNRVDPGDLVVNPLWLIGGAIGVSEEAGWVSPEYRVYRLAPSLLPRFAHHLLRSAPYRDQYQLLVRAQTTFDRRISKNDFHPLPMLLPSVAEQRRIASFLDNETERIDQLIATKSRMIELASERFRSAVSEGVGRGEKVEVRRLIAMRTSGPRGWGHRVGDCGDPFIRSQNLQREGIELKLSHVARVEPLSTPEAERSRTAEGDVLVGITGANTGWIGIVRSGAAGGFVSQHVAVLRPSGVNPEWLAYSVFSHQSQEQLLGGQYGGTKTQLGLDDLAKLQVRLPAPWVQVERVEALASGRAKARAIEELLMRQVQLLKARRRSLVTAAVTGEMEVA